ncbi:acyl carrier protein [Streptomyces vinaceus]|uniref:acyl carrier protein n=1 Tax=Streptomyces vinaceus TaxID=1960 RepID=UPI00381624EB
MAQDAADGTTAPQEDAAKGGIPALAEITERLIRVLDEGMGLGVPEGVANPTFEDLDIDSLSMVEFVVAVEDEFKVSFQDSEIKGLKTFDDLSNRIVAKLTDGQRSGAADAR